MLFELDGVAPVLEAGVWVAPNAAVIGNVWLGAGVTIWFGCTLRGDTNSIRVGAGTNVQDNSVLHVNPGAPWCLEIGEHVTIGHMALVHACRLEDRAFVGMGATVLDGAVIEHGGMLAAGGLLTPGKRIPSRELWGGRPARKMRDLPEDEAARNDAIATHYAARGQLFASRLKQVG